MVCEERQEESQEADRETMPRRISAQARLLVGRAGKAGIRDQPTHRLFRLRDFVREGRAEFFDRKAGFNRRRLQSRIGFRCFLDRRRGRQVHRHRQRDTGLHHGNFLRHFRFPCAAQTTCHHRT